MRVRAFLALWLACAAAPAFGDGPWAEPAFPGGEQAQYEATEPTPAPTPAVCCGDCDGNGRVTIAELVRAVRHALADDCP